MKEKYHSASQLTTAHHCCSALSTPAERFLAGFVSAPLHYIDWSCQITRKKFKDRLSNMQFYLTLLINPQLQFLFNHKTQKTLVLKTGLR